MTSKRPAAGRALRVESAVDPRWYLLPAGGHFAAARTCRRRHGLTRYLAPPDPRDPALLLPLEMPSAAQYGLRNFTFPRGRVRRLRRVAMDALLARRAFPGLGPLLGVESGPGGEQRPELVAATEALGLPQALDFFVRTGGGDSLARGLFFLFPAGSGDPSWVMKFGRVPGFAAQFDGDERGLRLAHESGATDGGHAPRFVGRFEVGGHHASVETAALGKPFGARLAERGLDGANRLTVERVATWLAARDAQTRRPPLALAAERLALDRLAAGAGLASLTEHLDAVPAVVAHNDLGCWNVLAAGEAFTVVDWELARPAGAPLWDLWYFLVDAVALADGTPRHDRERSVVTLFGGRHELSPLLFRLTRQVVDALAIPDDAVGALVTLCWLHHSGSYAERDAALRRHGFDADNRFRFPAPSAWLHEPGLGPGWRAWRDT